MKIWPLAIYLSVVAFPCSTLLAEDNEGRNDSTPATAESAIEWALPFLSDHFAEATLVDFDQAGDGGIVLERLSEEWFESRTLPPSVVKHLERYLILSDFQDLEPDHLSDVYVLRFKAKPTPEQIELLRRHFYLPYAWAPTVDGLDVFVGHPDRIAILRRREGGEGQLVKIMQSAGPAAVTRTYYNNQTAKQKLRDDIELAKQMDSKKVPWLELKRQLRWMQLSLTLQPQFKVKLRWQAKSNKVAEAVKTGIGERLTQLQEIAKPMDEAPPEAWQPLVHNARVKLIQSGIVSQDKQRIKFDSKLSPELSAKAYRTLNTAFALSDQRAERMATMKKVGMGILLFADRFGESMPRDICDTNGKPLMSWRVFILPVMDGGGKIYEQLRLDEPWDSPHNAPLLKQIDPRMFASNPKTPDGHADTLRVLGKGFGFVHGDPHKMVVFQDVTDGLHYTPMLVEVSPERSVPWAKPADYEWDPQKPTAGLGREGETYFDAVFGDATVRKVSKNESAETLRKLFGRADGKPDELKEPE